MNMVALLKFGSLFHIICALFHIIFPKLFKWNVILEKLSACDKAIIRDNIYTSNFLTPLFWITIAFLSFFFPNDLLSTNLGRSVLICITMIWFIRIFVLFPLFSNIKTKLSIARLLFFVIGFLLYLIPTIEVVFIK